MSSALLQAVERKESAKKVRRNGFVPAVIYGEGFERGMPVKLERTKLNKVLKDQGAAPRFSVIVNDTEKEVLVKEIQKDPITDQILHVDMQVLTGNERIKVKVPVVLTGREALEKNNLILEVFNLEVEISGPVNELPESFTIDVSEMNVGDTITAGDIELPGTNIRMQTPAEETLAVVSVPRQTSEEEAEDSDEEAEQ